jgi:hypothetical protein
MANTPNRRSSPLLVKEAPQINTNLGPIGGELGEIEEYETKRLRPLRIVQAEGGEFFIEFEYCLAEVDERLKDIEFIEGYEQLVEVELVQPSGTDNILLGWGEILTQDLKVRPGEERARVMAKITPPHFGTPLVGMHVANHNEPTPPVPDEDPFIHHGDIIFNPEIDGNITGNMTSPRVSVRKTYGDETSERMILSLWIDPESVRTENARIYVQRDYESLKWSLKEAVHTLCKVCNPLEEFIINPTLAELDAIHADEVTLRNIVLPAGEHLPELLNQLLKPHGYSWYLQPGRNEDSTSPDFGTTEIRLKIFKLGEGVKKTVHQPKPGDVLVGDGPQNVIEWNVTESFDELRNVVIAQGGLKEREITIELSRGWSASSDDSSVDDLSKDGQLFQSERNAWRLWVANEAGDYTSTRPEITEYPDFSDVLGDDSGVKRRAMKDCLTFQKSGEGELRRMDPFVEWRVTPVDDLEVVTITLHGSAAPPVTTLTASWTLHWMQGATELSIGPYDESALAATIEADLIAEGINDLDTAAGSLTSGIELTFTEESEAPDFWIEGTFAGGLNPGISIRSNAWQPIPDEWGPVLLGDQIGVYFAGDRALEELIPKGDNARIRITGTIIGDTRLNYTSGKESSSPLGHEFPLVLDVSDRFFDRKVQRTGRYMSRLLGLLQNDGTGSSGADERDDSDEIEEYADTIKAIEDAVNITGTLTLTGIRTEYIVGDLIKSIEGRKISLNRKATASGLTQYVQVTEKEILLQPKHRTILRLMPLDQSEAAIRSLERKRRRK